MSLPNPNNQIDNQTVIGITCLAIIASGILFDWHCYGFAIALAIIAFFGIIVMLVRAEKGDFR